MKMLIRRGKRKREKQLNAHGTKDKFSKFRSKHLTKKAGNIPASLSRECLAAHTLLGEPSPESLEKLPTQTAVTFHISHKSSS